MTDRLRPAPQRAFRQSHDELRMLLVELEAVDRGAADELRMTFTMSNKKRLKKVQDALTTARKKK